MSKSRNWCFTLNNPRWDQVQNLLDGDSVKFLIAVREVGESGTTHYQGYLELTSARALSTLKNWDGTIHWEIRRGTKSQAVSYVLKTLSDEELSGGLCATVFDEEFRTNGLPEGSSLPKWMCIGYNDTLKELALKCGVKEKTSLAERLTLIQASIRNGATDEDISDNHFNEWVRYRHAFTAYRLLKTKKRDFKTEVIVIQGPTGTGKSKYCQDEFPEAYWKTRDNWWDGYQQQDVVIIDEFYGWLQFDLLLRLCDRYPLDVEVKGGKVNFSSKKIVFTTNKIPIQWYTKCYFKAFTRRVEEWHVFGKCFRSKYTKYEDTKFIELGDEDTIGDISNNYY